MMNHRRVDNVGVFSRVNQAAGHGSDGLGDVMQHADAAVLDFELFVLAGRFVSVVVLDLLQRLADQRANPNANVRRQTVHQSETGHHFELVNVQLKSIESSVNALELDRKPLTLAETKMKYI